MSGELVEKAKAYDDERRRRTEVEDRPETAVEQDEREDERLVLERAIAEAEDRDGGDGDKIRVEVAKEKGTSAFKDKKYNEAIRWFSTCIDLTPRDPIHLSNRSAAYCAKKAYLEALADARKATQLDPDWPKGWSRVGAALTGQEDYLAAADAYRRALHLDPDNSTYETAVTKAEEAHKRQEQQGPRFSKKIAPSKRLRNGDGENTKESKKNRRTTLGLPLSFDDEEEEE